MLSSICVAVMTGFPACNASTFRHRHFSARLLQYHATIADPEQGVKVDVCSAGPVWHVMLKCISQVFQCALPTIPSRSWTHWHALATPEHTGEFPINTCL